jgi:protein-disulfide isomerase
MRLPVFAALIAALALPFAGCSKAAETASTSEPLAPVSKEFGDQVRAYILSHPEIIEEAANKLQSERQALAESAIKLSLQQNRTKNERDGRDFVAGNPNGKVTVVEYFDYRCPYCKAAIGDLNKLLMENRDVRLVLKEFPILSPTSERAARAAIGAKAQGKYMEVHSAFLEEKNLDDAAIDRILAQKGVDVAKAKAVGEQASTTAQLEEIRALGKTSGVTGTPAFIIGDRMVAGWQPDEILKEIAAVRKGG